MIHYFSDDTYFSYGASIITGCLLTVVIQSSSAMLGITIAMASTGIIGFNTAAALVLGENIGTTITAILASVGTSTNAKRAARGHAIFNLLGVVILFSIFPWYIEFIEWLIPGDSNMVAADGSKPNIATHIAASHTFFNITATLMFLPFLNQLAALVTKITPDKDYEEKSQFVLVGESSDVLPATAIAQAHAEVIKMKDIVCRMHRVTNEYLIESNSKKLAKVKEYERITDNIQKEVTVFCCKVMEKPMSPEQTKHIQAIIKIVDEFESIADYYDRIVSYSVRFKLNAEGGDSHKEYFDFMAKVFELFEQAFVGFEDRAQHNPTHIIKRSEELRIWADDIRDKHLSRVSKGEYEPLTALTYSDMVVALRKIRAHSMNVAEAISSIEPETV